MPNLFNDLGAGIETLFKAAAFDAVLIDSVDAGLHTDVGYINEADQIGKYGSITIIPLFVEQDPEATFQTSARATYHFDVYYHLESIDAGIHEKVNAYQQLVQSNFGDGGATLSSNITDNGSNLLDPQVTVAYQPALLETFRQGDDGGIVPLSTPRLTFPLDVTVWHKIPLA